MKYEFVFFLKKVNLQVTRYMIVTPQKYLKRIKLTKFLRVTMVIAYLYFYISSFKKYNIRVKEGSSFVIDYLYNRTEYTLISTIKNKYFLKRKFLV